MKLVLESGTLDAWMIIPFAAVIYDPKYKQIEIGIYFLKYFLTINLKSK